MKALLKTNDAVVQIKDEDLIKRFPELAAGYNSLKDAIKRREAERPSPLPQIAKLISSPSSVSASSKFSRPFIGCRRPRYKSLKCLSSCPTLGASASGTSTPFGIKSACARLIRATLALASGSLVT